jgi:vitamin B12 transporter
MRIIVKLLFIFFIFTESLFSNENILKKQDCSWSNRSVMPCINIESQISNSSKFTNNSINKTIITRKEIDEIGAIDMVDVLKLVPSINLTQSGSRGSQTSVFMRGTNSNHTLVLINGIPINDHSTTQGLHNFGVDFIQTIQQIEVYPGSSATHFGTNAIGGAINIVLTGDYKDSYTFNSDKDANFDLLSNKTFVNDNSSLNLKLGIVANKTISAKASDDEKDKLRNYSGNINYEKWISPELKFFNTTYLRQTLTEYDRSSTKDDEANNKMLSYQMGLKNINNKYDSSLVSYFNGYDRETDEHGTKDDFEGNTGGLKFDFSSTLNQNLSYGLGFDYKYEWAEFENRGSYTASTKGNSDNFALFTNVGLNIDDDTNISFFLRNDNHKQTGNNSTYKADFSRAFGNLRVGVARMTGLRNPTLYELYGTDNFGYSGNKNLDAEKSSTNEVYSNFLINEKSSIIVRGFRTNIRDNIEYLSNKYVNDGGETDLVQSGIENEFNYISKVLNLNLFSSFLSAKKKNGSDQLRRPEKTFGFNLSKKLNNNFLKNSSISLNYKHYGKHFDTHSINFSTIEMDSTDIINLNLTKKVYDNDVFIKINNLFGEKYQRPHGFGQDARIIKFGIKY